MLLAEEPFMMAGLVAILIGICLVGVSFAVGKKDQRKKSLALRDLALRQKQSKELSDKLRIQTARQEAIESISVKKEESLIVLGFKKEDRPSPEAIKAAWRTIMKINHPDVTGDSDGHVILKIATEAKEALLKPK